MKNALLLRYVAALLAGEELAYLTKRALRDRFGMTDVEIDRAVERVKKALER